MNSNEHKRSVLEQFRGRKPEDEDDIVEKWDKAYRQTWRSARPRSREDIMLDCRFSAGNRQAFAYPYLGSILFDGGTITLLFSDTALVVTGRNLDRLYDALVQHRVPFIQEGSDAEEALKPEDEPHIERIEITNGADEAER